MQDFLELARRRQSVRGFSDKPVSREELANCLEAARLAPSGCNSQPWSFVVVESPAVVERVAQAPRQLELNAYAETARAFVVVVEEPATLMPRLRKIFPSQHFAPGDLGAAAAYFCLAAADRGLGTCMLGVFDRTLLREELDIPAEKNIPYMIAVGYPADETIRPKSRKTLEEITRFV